MVTSSTPSQASPTTLKSRSDSSSRFSPSRKIGWSSAIRIRTVCDLRLSINGKNSSHQADTEEEPVSHGFARINTERSFVLLDPCLCCAVFFQLARYCLHLGHDDLDPRALAGL